MDPPNASPDILSQDVTQVTEQLSTMPETQRLSSIATPSHERKIQDANFLTALEGGPTPGDQSTPKPLSYLSGTTVENTPGVHQDIFMGLRYAGTPENSTLGGGWREEERESVSEGFLSSSPPVGTLPGWHSLREQGGDGEKVLSSEDVEGGGGEVPLSFQSGLRGGFSAERGSVEIPDSEGMEEEVLDGVGPETPVRRRGDEEVVIDTPFVELIASTDGATVFVDEGRGDLDEGPLFTAETKETESEIQDDGQRQAIQTTDDEFKIPEESQELAIQTIDTKDVASVILDYSQEPVTQSTKESEDEVLVTLESAIMVISDSSGQVSEVTKEVSEVTGTVDSSKEGLSEIVCKTLFISPDEHLDDSLNNSTAEEEINTNGTGLPTLQSEQEHMPMIEKKITTEELHSESTEATTAENPEPDDFGTDSSVTMELPVVMYLSDEDVHLKVSSDNEQHETPASHAGIETPSSEKQVIDPLEKDVISQDSEFATKETNDIESLSRVIDLPATILPPPYPFSSTNIESTSKEDQPVMATVTESQDIEITPSIPTPLTKGTVALQDQVLEPEKEPVELDTADHEICQNGVTSSIADLLPQEVTVLEGLGMGSPAGADVIKTTDGDDKANNREGHAASKEHLPEEEAVKEDELLVPSKEDETPENEPTLPATIILPSQGVLGDTGSGFTRDVSRSIRRTEIPDSDISLEDEDSFIEGQNLAVKGPEDGISGQLEMEDALGDATDVTTSRKELENDGYNDAPAADEDGTSNPAIQVKIPPSETRSQGKPDRDLVKTNSAGKIIDEKAPVPALATESTVSTRSSESLTHSKEDLAQPSDLIRSEKATSLDPTAVEEELNFILPPTSLPAKKLAIPLTADQIFQPGTAKLQVQDSESVKARPNQEPKENITTCKVIVIPASSESQLSDAPPSSSSSSSIQQPSTVVDIPPMAPHSPKAKRKLSKKRTSLAVEELSSSSKTDIPSLPPQKKPRLEDASPTKPTEEEKSPAKNKDEILMDELRAMKVVCSSFSFGSFSIY